MQITRLIADFGNSMSKFLIEGRYFEMPSAICEISETEANGMFVDPISQDKLLAQLVIRVPDGEKNRYYKVGEKAQGYALANSHIDRLHDKSESLTVWITFLAGIAYYNAYQNLEVTEDEVNVDQFLTLLPVWLVKRAERFGEALGKMAQRFHREIKIKLLTAGFERELLVKIAESTCRVEGETARFALKYDLELNLKDEAEKFEKAFVVIDDLGGQSQDLSRLQPGLGRAQSADDFSSNTDQSFLSTLEELRVSKLMVHFSDVREVEAFILKNITSRKYIYTDPTTRQETDYTAVIERTLRSFARVAMEKAIHAFQFADAQEVYFVHIGGVNQALRLYMQEYLAVTLGANIANQYHVFPEDSRKLNVYGAEIVLKSELKKRQRMKDDDQAS